MKGSRSQQASPPNSGSDSSSLGSQGTSGSIEYGTSDCAASAELPCQFSSSSVFVPPTKDSHPSIHAAESEVVSIGGTSTDLAAIVDSTQSEQPKHHDTAVFHTSECSSPTEYTGLELTSVGARPLVLHHSHIVEEVEPVGDESTMSWLYDFYPKALGSRPKDELESYVDQSEDVSKPLITDLQDHLENHQHAELLQLQEHIEQPLTYPGQTLFKSQEKYVVTLGAPISIAQRRKDDTLTYVNKGQFYNICVSSNPRLSRPLRVKTTLALTFFDEGDSKLELNHWQYWHNLQANPNQKAFDIDRKNCEHVIGNFEDLAYNATSFTWSPEVGAKIVVRINCLSTEFSSQKGVKGLPLYLVTDTYETLDSVVADPVHRAFCRIKVFRDKGAERKNKDETRSVERRLKFLKEKAGGGKEDHPDMFHPPSKLTTFTSTSTLGPKLFLFTPQNHPSSSSEGNEESVKGQSEAAPSTFLANIKDRVNKRSFSKALREAKEDLGALEVEEGEEEETPPSKAPRIPSQSVTVYVRKSEESIYKALVLNSMTVENFKTQVAKKYDVPVHMIKDIFKRTKKGLLVHFDEDMISRFQDEDDFIVDLTFDNQKGSFDLFIHY